MPWSTDIYGFSKNVKKSKAYLPMVPNQKSWCTLTTINKDAHRIKRKIVSQSLSDHALKEFEPALHKHIDNFCHKLGKEIRASTAGRRVKLCMNGVSEPCRYYGRT